MTSTAVTVGVPVIGAIVEITFQDGDLQYGMYGGSLHTGHSNQLGELDVNYPNRRGFLDPAENFGYIDITEGMVKFHLQHRTTTFGETTPTGAINVGAVDDIRVWAPMIYLN
jgi:hypothetical protein